MKLILLVVTCYCAAVYGQQVGTNTPENHPPLSVQSCTKSGGCQSEQKSVVVDSNWRWTHVTSGTKNCYTGNTWDTSICPNGPTCAQNCALDGADYQGTYGVYSAGTSLQLKFEAGPKKFLSPKRYGLKSQPSLSHTPVCLCPEASSPHSAPSQRVCP